MQASWSNDGNYLAVSTYLINGHQLDIYSWNGSDTLTYICAYDYGNGNYFSKCSWSSDGTFIACVGSKASNQIVVLSFNGSALTERETVGLTTNYIGYGISWSRGGNYLLIGSAYYSATSSDNSVLLYSWTPSTYTLTEVDVVSVTKAGSYGVGFNYTNNYFAYSGYNTQDSPYNILYAGTTGLTSCDYRTNFLLQTTATSIIRGK
jgi:hypothetical protein